MTHQPVTFGFVYGLEQIHHLAITFQNILRLIPLWESNGHLRVFSILAGVGGRSPLTEHGDPRLVDDLRSSASLTGLSKRLFPLVPRCLKLAAQILSLKDSLPHEIPELRYLSLGITLPAL